LGSSSSTIQSTAPEEDAPAAPARRLLLFSVGGRVFGSELEVVREIIPCRSATRLPGAPAYVAGLINLRGTLVTVVDLGLRLGGAAVDRETGSIVIVEHGAKLAGLAVDEVSDVQSLDAADLEAAAGSEGDGGIVRGVGRAGGETVVVLDVRPRRGRTNRGTR
jgi:purine-binding chemotaxis protein CheW